MHQAAAAKDLAAKNLILLSTKKPDNQIRLLTFSGDVFLLSLYNLIQSSAAGVSR
jgi:hypothetical protein